MTAIEEWDRYAAALQPNFELSAEDAYKQAIPKTREFEQMLQIHVAHALEVDISQPGAASAEPPAEGAAAPAQPTPLPSTTQLRDRKLGVDPMMAYSAATALYQEVQILNRHVLSAVIDEGYSPFLVRAQVAVLPFARNRPYDTYVNITLDGAYEKYASESYKPVKVVPLLVAENLERSLETRAMARLTEFALAVSAMANAGTQPVKLKGSTSRKVQKLQAALGQDLNSLMTVTRASPNTLRVRLGAMNQGSTRQAMVPRTHNVTFLLLVPDEFVPHASRRAVCSDECETSCAAPSLAGDAAKKALGDAAEELVAAGIEYRNTSESAKTRFEAAEKRLDKAVEAAERAVRRSCMTSETPNRAQGNTAQHELETLAAALLDSAKTSELEKAGVEDKMTTVVKKLEGSLSVPTSCRDLCEVKCPAFSVAPAKPPEIRLVARAEFVDIRTGRALKPNQDYVRSRLIEEVDEVARRYGLDLLRKGRAGTYVNRAGRVSRTRSTDRAYCYAAFLHAAQHSDYGAFRDAMEEPMCKSQAGFGPPSHAESNPPSKKDSSTPSEGSSSAKSPIQADSSTPSEGSSSAKSPIQADSSTPSEGSSSAKSPIQADSSTPSEGSSSAKSRSQADSSTKPRKIRRQQRNAARKKRGEPEITEADAAALWNALLSLPTLAPEMSMSTFAVPAVQETPFGVDAAKRKLVSVTAFDSGESTVVRVPGLYGVDASQLYAVLSSRPRKEASKGADGKAKPVSPARPPVTLVATRASVDLATGVATFTFDSLKKAIPAAHLNELVSAENFELRVGKGKGHSRGAPTSDELVSQSVALVVAPDKKAAAKPTNKPFWNLKTGDRMVEKGALSNATLKFVDLEKLRPVTGTVELSGSGCDVDRVVVQAEKDGPSKNPHPVAGGSVLKVYFTNVLPGTACSLTLAYTKDLSSDEVKRNTEAKKKGEGLVQAKEAKDVRVFAVYPGSGGRD